MLILSLFLILLLQPFLPDPLPLSNKPLFISTSKVLLWGRTEEPQNTDKNQLQQREKQREKVNHVHRGNHHQLGVRAAPHARSHPWCHTLVSPRAAPFLQSPHAVSLRPPMSLQVSHMHTSQLSTAGRLCLALGGRSSELPVGLCRAGTGSGAVQCSQLH